MKPTLPRLAGIVTGVEIFRVASLCLYITLLLHVVLASYVRNLTLSPISMTAVSLLAVLTLSALARYVWPDALCYGRGRLITELALSTFIVVGLTLQDAIPALPLPWMIGLAGVFPLALEASLARLSTVAITAIGFALNTTLGMQWVDWLPHMFATVFVGLSATVLSDALGSNVKALQQADNNQRHFNAIARAARHVFMITDAQFRIKFVNQALQDIIGYPLDKILAEDFDPVIHADDMDEHRRKLQHLRATPRSTIFSRHRVRHHHGHWVWLETRGHNMLHDEAINGLIFSIDDISARKDAELRLQEEHALLRAVLDLNPAMIYATDASGRFTISNQAFQQRFGYTSEDHLRGKTIEDLCRVQQHAAKPDVRQDAHQFFAQDLEVIRTGVPLPEHEIQGLWGQDQHAWHRVGKYPLRDTAGRVAGMLCIARDVTERKEYEMRLQHQALHDPLTGLPNRRYLLKTIADSIADADKTSQQLAMLFCDLDFFKSVNDTHGHDFGDKCLMEITRRIRSELPTGDFVSRFGGNEFVVLSHASVDEAKAKADALLQAVSQQLVVDDAVVKIQTSIGIARLEPEHKNPSELIRAADAAMYQAKERGRNRAEVFDATLQSHSVKRGQMDVALRFALERDELRLVYQPKISILNGAVKGFELLLRWQNASYGSIPPMEFIPIAESSGLVVPIGLWVLEEACKQLHSWRHEFPKAGGFTIAVNVSMRQLLQSTFLDEVTSILKRTGVPPQLIELELTETSAMANPLQTIETLSRLKQLGLRLALDDFGTGYSSLAYLQKLPVDVLKIDKTFVQGVGKNASDAEIVRLILALAQTLNLETVAEGVETRDDMIELKKMGCYLAQGYAFSPPVEAHQAAALLRTGHHFVVA